MLTGIIIGVFAGIIIGFLIIYLAMPSLPLVQKETFTWSEALPIEIAYTGMTKHMRLLFASLRARGACASGEWRCNNNSISPNGTGTIFQ